MFTYQLCLHDCSCRSQTKRFVVVVIFYYFMKFFCKMKSARKLYSIEYKKKIVLESQGKNLVSFCKNKQLDLRMVHKWQSKFEQMSFLEENGHAKKRSVGSG